MRVADEVFVRSVGSFLPPATPTEQAVEGGRYARQDLEAFGLTGTLIAGDLPPAEMTLAAARVALDRGGLESADLTHILHTSVLPPGPDGWSLPGHTLLNLGGGTASVTELRTGCAGMLSAFELAVGQMTGFRRAENVLVTAADNFGPWLDRWPADVFIPSDAASAALLSRTDGFARVLAIGSATDPELEEMQRGDQPLYPPSRDGRRIDLQGRHASFGDRVMPEAEAAKRMSALHTELVQQSLAEAGLGTSDVARLLYHNMAGFVLDQFFLGPLGLDLDRSGWEFGRTVGHMGGSDQIVALEHLVLTGAVAPGDHILLCGAAAGFASSCVVLRILELPEWGRPS